MLRRILALMIKEFLALLKDKRGRTVLILPPIIQLVVFGYAATYDLKNVSMAIFNEDQGQVSREVISRFEGSQTFRRVMRLEHAGEIEAVIDRKEALLVLHFGPDFSKKVYRNETAPLQVIIDGRNSNSALILLGYTRTIITDFNENLSARKGLPGLPARLNVRAWFNPNLESQWFIVPGIVGLLTLVVTLLVTALSVAREREAGTFDQLLVTPLRPVEILLGKALPGFIIGTVEASFIIIMAVIWFRISLIGSIFALYLGLLLFLMSAIGIGLMISSLSLTQQQGLFGAFMFLVPSVTLSGFATPIENMPVFLQHVTLFNPLRYFLVILRGVFLEGSTVSLLYNQYWPMAVIGIINLVLAGWLFRHRMY